MTMVVGSTVGAGGTVTTPAPIPERWLRELVRVLVVRREPVDRAEATAKLRGRAASAALVERSRPVAGSAVGVGAGPALAAGATALVPHVSQ
jgi:hypothetical protein